MYFAVLWKNPGISEAEIQLVKPEKISYPKKGIMVFDTKFPELLPKLGGIIKSGEVVKEKELKWILENAKIVGIQNEANGKHLKRTIGIKRYKLVDIIHTDKEIKSKGKEIINLENGIYGLVERYQDIELYEAIDFGKPWRSMDMGMMPAKLAHIMVDIWLQQSTDKTNCIIYDPFVGSWTTGFQANAMRLNFIGSDIKTKYIIQNLAWRKTTKFYRDDREFLVFDHDITQKMERREIKEKANDMIIVTEGRLGPIVSKTTPQQDIKKFQNQVEKVYTEFLEMIKNLWCPTAVFTIPRYSGQENTLEKKISDYGTKIWLHIDGIPEVYGRSWQHVGRKIMIIKR